MNDLSSSSDPVHANQPQDTVPPAVTAPAIPAVSAGSKEVVGGAVNQGESLRDGTGAEFELPKEVVSAGVRIQPTTIPIPPNIAQLGVKPAGQNIPVAPAASVVLPLTDDQIAAGLHAGLTDSIRWLAEWCIRRLKHLHIALKNVHGASVRVKET